MPPTTLSELTDLTTVEQARNNVYFIGEEHTPPGAPVCRRLAENLLDELEPAAIGIEMPPGQTPHGSAMGVCAKYAKGNPECDAFLVDKSRHDLRAACESSGHNYIDVTSKANEFTHPITDGGDLPTQAILDARDRIYEEFGREVFMEMYKRRERQMGRRMSWLAEQYDGPVLWSGGVFHIKDMRKRVNANYHDAPDIGQDALPIQAASRKLHVSDA